jgi:hypothetical protein
MSSPIGIKRKTANPRPGQCCKRGGFMKGKWIGIGLMAAFALPVYAQEKEEERVENANKLDSYF